MATSTKSPMSDTMPVGGAGRAVTPAGPSAPATLPGKLGGFVSKGFGGMTSKLRGSTKKPGRTASMRRALLGR